MAEAFSSKGLSHGSSEASQIGRARGPSRISGQPACHGDGGAARSRPLIRSIIHARSRASASLSGSAISRTHLRAAAIASGVRQYSASTRCTRFHITACRSSGSSSDDESSACARVRASG